MADHDLDILDDAERDRVAGLARLRPAAPADRLRLRIESTLSTGGRRTWRLIAAVAAAAAAIMLVGLLTIWRPQSTTPPPTSYEKTYSVPVGQPARSIDLGMGISAIVQPGGQVESTVSDVRPAKAGTSPDQPVRLVRMRSGRARFAVKPSDHPAVIETPTCNVQVTGTEFEIDISQTIWGEDTMKSKNVVRVAVLLGAVVVFNSFGHVDLATGEQAEAKEGQAPSKANVDAIAAMFTNHYKPVSVTTQPAVPDYTLPVDLATVANYAAVDKRLKLGRFQELLSKNGFAVAPWEVTGYQCKDFADAYGDIKEWELPVFITSDSLLHLYHIQFDETLRKIEERVFASDLQAMLEAMQSQLAADYAKADGEMKAAIGISLGQTSVSLRLLTDTTQMLEAMKACRAAGAEAVAGKAEVGDAHRETLRVLAEVGEPMGIREWEIYDLHNRECLDKMDRIIARVEKQAAAAHSVKLPEEITKAVQAELKLIAAHGGFAASPIYTYEEDYSQYVPRGHYTRSELLRRYFKSMMYLGRMTYLLRGEQDTPAGIKVIIDSAGAKQQTVAAAHMTRLLLTGTAADKRKLADIWQRIYAVTAFYVGVADDLTFRDYANALAKVIGKDLDASKLLDDKTFFAAKVELAGLRGPAICSGTGRVGIRAPAAMSGSPSSEDLAKSLEATAGLRVMGQRFVPDSYVTGKMVFPTVGDWTGDTPLAWSAGMTLAGPPRRCFPRGLDVMNAFGSDRAGELLNQTRDTAYRGYDAAAKDLRTEFDRLAAADWNRNLYWSWIYSLKGLTLPAAKGYPSFMRTLAWQDRQLHTACASWSQLRHDTILYAKQSATPKVEAAPPPAKKYEVTGYVEPSVEFYNRLLALNRMTIAGLNELNVLDDAANQRLAELDKILQQLIDISVKELGNKDLNKDEYEFIKTFGGQLSGTLGDITEKARDTRIVADVHTDGNSGLCVEEATGPIDLVLVIYRLPDGTLGMGVGPTLSYYEFKQPMAERLTDEAWQAMLTRDRDKSAGKRPNWTGSFLTPPNAK